MFTPQEQQQELVHIKQMLPLDYIISPYDVIICDNNDNNNIAAARQHNKRFHRTIQMNLKRYTEAGRNDRNKVIDCIIDSIRQRSIVGGFIKRENHTGIYFEVGDFNARKKVIRAFREAQIIKHKNFRKTIRTSSKNDCYITSSSKLSADLGFGPLEESLDQSSSAVATAEPLSSFISPLLLHSSPSISLSQEYEVSHFFEEDEEEILPPPLTLPSWTPSYGENNSSNNIFQPSDFQMKKCSLDLLSDDSEHHCSTDVASFFQITRQSSARTTLDLNNSSK